MTTRLLLKTDGSVQTFEHALSMNAILDLVAPKTKTLDTVNVRRHVRIAAPKPGDDSVFLTFDVPPGHVLIVDDTGLIDGREINRSASQIYRAQCRTEYQDQAQIAGDAFVCPDEDFA